MINIGLIGLGNIGQGYDSHDESLVLSHARAIKNFTGLNLLVAVDPDPNKRAKFSKKYFAEFLLKDIDEKVCRKIDLAIVASPPGFHLKILLDLANLGVQNFIIEKPITDNEKDTSEFIKHVKKNNLNVFVNYVRPYTSGISQVKKYLSLEKLGKVMRASFFFSGDILISGGHFIDLALYLFDNNLTGKCSIEFVSPNLFSIDINGIRADFNIINGLNYNVGKGLFFLENGYIKFNDGDKVEIFSIESNRHFIDEFSLRSEMTFDNYDGQYLAQVYNEIFSNYGNEAFFKRSIFRAKKAEDLAFEIKNRLKNVSN